MWRYNSFSLSHDLSQACGENIKNTYEKELFKLSDHPAKFGGHRNCGSRDTTALARHLILQEDMIKESSNSMGRSHTR